MNRDTICVQGGYTPGNGEPRQIPIIQSTTFKYATSEDMGKLFDLEADGYFYSRLQNPTCDLVAKKICELEGGTAAMLTSSGQAANFFALFNLCEAGDHIVASSTIYGGTFNLISVTMKKMGIEATFVDPLCTEEELNAAFRPNTKMVFGETIANPALTVLDIEKFAAVAHRHGVPVIVDAAAQTPPAENLWKFTGMGADLVIFSGGKTMRGPQDSGLIVGKKEWIDRCRRWGPPTDGVCRGCKTSRESIVGLYKAVQLYLQRDEATLMRTLNRRCAAFERTLRDCGFIQITRTQEGPVGQVMARTYAVMPYGSAKDLADKMRANGIYIGAEPGNRILLNPLMVTPAQVKTVCETLTTCMQQIKEEL